MRVAGYCRRSQEHQEESVDRQDALIREYVRRKGWTLVEMYRDDQKNTGRKEFKKRREFLRMLDDAEHAKFDMIVCRDLSRLGGDTARTMLAIEELQEVGIKIRYYADDTEQRLDNWVDKTMLAIKSGAAEGERDAISARTREALQVKAQQALCVGGRCYGYDLIPILEGSVKKRTEYAKNETEAAVVREIFERYSVGIGLKGIAKELNDRGIPSPRTGSGSWSPTSIRPMLRRERYIGGIVWGQKHKTYRRGTKVRVRREPCVVVEAEHLRIIDDALWAAVQERFARQKRLTGKAGPRAPGVHMLSGFARCGVCGGAVSAESQKWGANIVKVYLCKKRRQSGASACSNNARRPVSSVDETVLGWIQNTVLTEEFIAQTMKEIRSRLASRSRNSNQELPALETQARKLRGEIEKLGESLLASDAKPSVVVKMISERETALHHVEARIATAKVAPAVLDFETRRIEKEAKAKLADARALLAGSPADARRAMEALLDGPLTVTPLATANGARFRLTGRVVLGELDLKESGGTPDQVYRRGRPRRDSNPC